MTDVRFSCFGQFGIKCVNSVWSTNALPIYKEHEGTYQPSEKHANKLKGRIKTIEGDILRNYSSVSSINYILNNFLKKQYVYHILNREV